MDITFKCDRCWQQIVVDEKGAGITVQCPKCNQTLTVPRATTRSPLERPAPQSEITRPNAIRWRPAVVISLVVVVMATIGVAWAVKAGQQDQKIKALEQRVAGLEGKALEQGVGDLEVKTLPVDTESTLEQRVADLEKAVGQLRGSLAGVAGMASHAERAVRRTPVPPGSSQRWNGPP